MPSQVAAGSCRDLPAEAIAKASTWVKFGNHCFLDQSEVFPSNPTTTPRQPNLIMSDELKTIQEKGCHYFLRGIEDLSAKHLQQLALSWQSYSKNISIMAVGESASAGQIALNLRPAAMDLCTVRSGPSCPW